MGLRYVAEALRAAGLRVEVHADHFDPDAPDREWLAAVGARGWIVLSKDCHIRHNQNELEAILRGRVAAFLLGKADLTGEEMARAFTIAIRDMARMADRYERPFLAQVSPAGKVSRLLLPDDIARRIDPRP